MWTFVLKHYLTLLCLVLAWAFLGPAIAAFFNLPFIFVPIGGGLIGMFYARYQPIYKGERSEPSGK